MKITCPRESLLAATQLVSAAVAARDIKPILHNLHAVAEGGRFLLSATDLEVGIRHELRWLTIEEEGEAIIPADKTTKILREVTAADLRIDADENRVFVRDNFNEFEMSSENPKEFPSVPLDIGDAYHEVLAGAIALMSKRTAFAAARESTKFAMTGVLWEVEGSTLRLVATDSKRMAVTNAAVTSKGAGDTGKISHLIPTKAMKLLEQTVAKLPADAPVKFCLRHNDALFQTDTTTIYSRLVEGRFPPWREILPKKTTARVPLPVQPFLTAVRQASIMTDDETKRVAFRFAKGQLTLEAQGPTTGRSKVPMAIEYDGSPIDINFDPGYLVEMLRVLGPEDPLVLELVDGSRPALFKSGPDYSYLVMPLS